MVADYNIRQIKKKIGSVFRTHIYALTPESDAIPIIEVNVLGAIFFYFFYSDCTSQGACA